MTERPHLRLPGPDAVLAAGQVTRRPLADSMPALAEQLGTQPAPPERDDDYSPAAMATAEAEQEAAEAGGNTTPTEQAVADATDAELVLTAEQQQAAVARRHTERQQWATRLANIMGNLANHLRGDRAASLRLASGGNPVHGPWQLVEHTHNGYDRRSWVHLRTGETLSASVVASRTLEYNDERMVAWRAELAKEPAPRCSGSGTQDYAHDETVGVEPAQPLGWCHGCEHTVPVLRATEALAEHDERGELLR